MLTLQLKLIMIHEDGSLFMLGSAVQKILFLYLFYVFYHLETEAQIVVICRRLDVAEVRLLLGLLV